VEDRAHLLRGGGADDGLWRAHLALRELRAADHHPILGEAAGVPGFFLANGFSGHGVMHAPATGKILSAFPPPYVAVLKDKAVVAIDVAHRNVSRGRNDRCGDLLGAARLQHVLHERVLDPHAQHAAAHHKPGDLAVRDDGGTDQPVIGEAVGHMKREHPCIRRRGKLLQLRHGEHPPGGVELGGAAEQLFDAVELGF